MLVCRISASKTNLISAVLLSKPWKASACKDFICNAFGFVAFIVCFFLKHLAFKDFAFVGSVSEKFDFTNSAFRSFAFKGFIFKAYGFKALTGENLASGVYASSISVGDVSSSNTLQPAISYFF